MKNLFASIALVLLCGSFNFTSAQTYTVTPNDTIVVNAPYNTLSIYDIWQNNTTSSPIDLGWTLITSNLVAGWDYSLCDLGHCYTGLPASGQMDPVPVSGQGFLGLNIDPGTTSGTGTVRIYVYDITAPNDGDTLTWIISTPVGIEAYASMLRVDLYPNPASDKIFVRETSSNENALQITMHDMSGRTVNISVQNQMGVYTIDIAALPAGNYILTCETAEGLVAQRHFIKTSE